MEKSKEIGLNLFLGMTIIFISLVSAACTGEKLSKDDPLSLYTNLKDPDHIFTKVDFNEFANLIESREPVLTYLGRPSCSACQQFVPLANKLFKRAGINIYYLNTEEVDDEERVIVSELTDIKLVPFLATYLGGERVVDSNNPQYSDLLSEETIDLYIENYLALFDNS